MHYLELNMKQTSGFERAFGILSSSGRSKELRILHEGANRNYATAFRGLGIAYVKGKFGAEVNMNKALQNLEKAVSMGDSKSKVALARILLQEGKPWTNTDRAVRILKDASRTDPEATLVLAKYVDQLEKQGKIRVMTPDDLGWKARA
jgi:TPR repeat protein